MEKYFPPVISQKIFIDTQYTLNYDAWLSCCSSAPPPTWCSYHDLQHAGVGLVDDLRLHERWSDREVVRMDLLQPHGGDAMDHMELSSGEFKEMPGGFWWQF